MAANQPLTNEEEVSERSALLIGSLSSLIGSTFTDEATRLPYMRKVYSLLSLYILVELALVTLSKCFRYAFVMEIQKFKFAFNLQE